VAADKGRAARLFTAAWQGGDPEGAFLLATAHRLELFDGADPSLARDLLIAAADRGHVAAQKTIYALRNDAAAGFSDEPFVVDYLKAAATGGDKDAMIALASHYRRNGQVDDARQLLEVAAEAGSLTALTALISLERPRLREGGNYTKIIRLLEAHTADPATADSAAFFMLAVFESMTAVDEASRARVEAHLRAAAGKHDMRARLALQLASGGMLLTQAVREASQTSDADAYVRFMQLLSAASESNETTSAKSPPIPTRIVDPKYPEELVAERVVGTVQVAFTVNAKGRVMHVEVVSSTHEAFRQPAIDAVRQWIFTPGRKDGHPVHTRMMVPLRFRMSE